jgi:vacuolar-type H+-ATPase subunit I/STV1
MSDEETGETIVEYKFTEHSYEEESVDMEELMKEMMAMLAEIKDMLKPDEEEEPAEDKDEQDMEDKDMEEGKDKEMSDNSETVELNEQESLKEKIASLEYELKAQRVLGEVEKELSGLDEQTKKDMAALKIANKDFYERLASQMKKNNITLGEVGEVGTPSQVIMNFSEAKKAARKAGCKAGEETLEWISKHYPQFV